MAGSSEVIRRSLERDLANVEDSLYRYLTLAAKLEAQRDELRAALESLPRED